jgi:hypothetical protein
MYQEPFIDSERWVRFGWNLYVEKMRKQERLHPKITSAITTFRRSTKTTWIKHLILSQSIAYVEIVECCMEQTRPCMHRCRITTDDSKKIFLTVTAYDIISNELWPLVVNKQHFVFMFSILLEDRKSDDLSSFSLFLKDMQEQDLLTK